MPVPAVKLVNAFKRKANAYDTGAGQSYDVVDIVNTLNEAYEIFAENTMRIAETSNEARDLIRQLEVKNKELEVTYKGDGVYYAEYPENFFKRLNIIADVKCVDCECDSKRIVPRIVQSDDLYDALRSPYRKPNFAWEQMLADEAGEGIYIYTGEDIEIESVRISYYKKITRIEAPSLITCEPYGYVNELGQFVNKDVDFELDSRFAARRVEDIAEILRTRDVRDNDKFQTQLNKYLTIPKL